MINFTKVLSDQNGRGKIISGILVIGSIWGLLDAITVKYISPLFHVRGLCLCPLTVVFLGFLLMSLALVIYKKPMMLIGIGIIAALFKLLNFAVISLPIINGHTVYQPVVNPALASITASLVYALFASFLMNKLENNIYIRIIVGVLAGFLSTAAFIYSAFYITHTPPLIISTTWQMLLPFHGPVAAALGAIFLTTGYWAASKIQLRANFLQIKKPLFYYLGSGAIVIFSVIISIIIHWISV